VTPEARSRAPFELLRFTAAPAAGALVVLELEGRFAGQAGRFARRPVLVVEPGADRARLELAPVRTSVRDERWQGAYAVPAEALRDDARLALGVRGTLLELPAPDEPPAGDRLAALAREANALRRALEAAEAEAEGAQAEAAAAAAALEDAVAAAREEERAASAERIDALEHEVVEAHRLAAEDVERARSAAVADTAAEHERTTAEATERAEAAEQHAEAAEERARAAERDAEQARAQASVAAEEAETLRERLRAAEAGTDVLRAELAEERERAQARLAAPVDDEDDKDDDADETRPFTVSEQLDADADATQPVAPATEARPRSGADRETRVRTRAGIFDPLPADAPEHPRHGPNLSPWIAVGALLVFAFVLLGLLLGFLG
jgi:hypothetical protein